ncbi:MAG: permease [Candidatus Omnitrophica bacterium]|nr:permease [Candidatus Omnitrophota bacterium]
MEYFIQVFLHYVIEILPALTIGFFISGLVHELIPEDIVLKYLGRGGIQPIFYSTLVGTFLPVCCWGSLPIAVSFYKKGARLGPILAFLVATPATSVSALLVTYSVLGLKFAVYIFFAVIVMGVITGLIGNMIKHEPKKTEEEVSCPHCETAAAHEHEHGKKNFLSRITSILRYAYIDLPKEIGIEILVGILLAAVVATFVPIGRLIKLYLGGWFGYVFSIVFGLIMYICSTATPPLVDSLIKQGLNVGAGMALLLIGPVTSYGTILVLRKEYGMKVLSIFLISLIILSLLLGLGFQVLQGNPRVYAAEESAAKVKEVDVEAYQYGFSPNPIVVKKGDNVKLNITSRDVTHGFYIGEYKVNVAVKKGAVTEVKFVADRPGEFDIICSVYCGPGHSGMKGRLVIEE